MQPSAGPALPHTRSTLVHWLVTAAALAAVCGGAALVQPPDAAARATAPAAGDAGPDPDRARYPMDCGPWPTETVHRAAVDFDGDGRRETVAVVRCGTGTGTPPSGIFVLARPEVSGGRPLIAEMLLDPAEQLSIADFTVRDGMIAVKLLGYSSDEVPRCCPDQERKVTWDFRDNEFRLRAAPPAGSV